jgi:hypothetical protein
MTPDLLVGSIVYERASVFLPQVLVRVQIHSFCCFQSIFQAWTHLAPSYGSPFAAFLHTIVRLSKGSLIHRAKAMLQVVAAVGVQSAEKVPTPQHWMDAPVSKCEFELFLFTGNLILLKPHLVLFYFQACRS